MWCTTDSSCRSPNPRNAVAGNSRSVVPVKCPRSLPHCAPHPILGSIAKTLLGQFAPEWRLAVATRVRGLPDSELTDDDPLFSMPEVGYVLQVTLSEGSIDVEANAPVIRTSCTREHLLRVGWMRREYER